MIAAVRVVLPWSMLFNSKINRKRIGAASDVEFAARNKRIFLTCFKLCAVLEVSASAAAIHDTERVAVRHKIQLAIDSAYVLGVHWQYQLAERAVFSYADAVQENKAFSCQRSRRCLQCDLFTGCRNINGGGSAFL